MKVGKVPEAVLKRSVLKQIRTDRPEVLMGASVGEDCAAVALQEDEMFVLSTDPITGTAKDIGHLAIQITLNDLASAGAEPIGVMLAFLLPEKLSEAKLRAMKPEEFAQLQQAVISQMLQAPQTLGDEASKLSKDFDRGNMRFDSRDKVVAQIKLLTPQKLADFFHQTVVDPQGMTILSQISGSQNGKADYAQPKGGKVWENVSALQQSLPLMRENE